jgi:hypothetical protein
MALGFGARVPPLFVERVAGAFDLFGDFFMPSAKYFV